MNSIEEDFDEFFVIVGAFFLVDIDLSWKFHLLNQYSRTTTKQFTWKEKNIHRHKIRFD